MQNQATQFLNKNFQFLKERVLNNIKVGQLMH